MHWPKVRFLNSFILNFADLHSKFFSWRQRSWHSFLVSNSGSTLVSWPKRMAPGIRSMVQVFWQLASSKQVLENQAASLSNTLFSSWFPGIGVATQKHWETLKKRTKLRQSSFFRQRAEHSEVRETPFGVAPFEVKFNPSWRRNLGILSEGLSPRIFSNLIWLGGQLSKSSPVEWVGFLLSFVLGLLNKNVVHKVF